MSRKPSRDELDALAKLLDTYYVAHERLLSPTCAGYLEDRGHPDCRSVLCQCTCHDPEDSP